MLGLGGTKALVLVLMAVLTLAVALLPLVIRKLALKYMQHNSVQKFMSGCLCFGGGVLLATVFLHLLPEVRVYLDLATTKGFLPNLPYPLAELIVCIGFYFIYMCEELVHACVHHHHDPHATHAAHVQPANTQNFKMNTQVSESDQSNASYRTEVSVDDPSLEKFLPSGEEESKDQEGKANGTENNALSMLRTLLVVMALSLHSIMEGLALGLVHSPKDVWVLFGALSAHKLIIAFCIAMELLESGASKMSFLVSMIVFSLASPLGGMVGALVVSVMTETTPAGVLVPTVLQGISAGTILYVTFCEVLERERAKTEIGQIRMWTFFLGFVFMAALQVIDSYIPEDPLAEPKATVLPKILASTFLPSTDAW